MALRTPSIALPFTRDTVYPVHTRRLHFTRADSVIDDLYFVSWVIVHKFKLHVHYREENVYFVGDYIHLRGKKAIDWLSQKIGRSFLDYAAELFVELYEQRKAVCDTEPTYEGQIMFFPDKGNRGLYLYGIDFENQIIKVADAWNMKVMNYPAVEALKMLGISWNTLRRSFGLGYLVKHNNQKLIDALNELVKEEVVIKIQRAFIIRESKRITYRIEVVAANPNNIAFHVEFSLDPHLKSLAAFAELASYKDGITIIGFNSLTHRMLYLPAQQKVIFHFREKRLPMELRIRRDNLQVIWGHDTCILFGATPTHKHSRDKLKISERELTKEDFDKLMSVLELRLRESKHI